MLAICFNVCYNERYKIKGGFKVVEEWKEIEGYNGMFSVSNYGNIKTHYTNTILKPMYNKGDIFVVAQIQYKHYNFQVKAEVVKAFIDKDYNYKKSKIINIDGNIENNHDDNLEIQSKNNRYEIIDNYVIGYTVKDEKFYFDLEDFETVKEYQWYLKDSKYIATNTPKDKNKKIKYLHLVIMSKYYDLSDNKIQVDHIISKNKTDNRKSNLRRCSSSQNNMNRSLGKSNTSGIIGISLRLHKTKKNKVSEYWNAHIKNNNIYLSKQFKTKDDAIKWRLQKELELFGEFAPQRHMFEKYNIK